MAGGEPRLGTTATYMRHNDHGTTRLSTEIDILHDLINDEYRVFSAGSVRKWSKFGLRKWNATIVRGPVEGSWAPGYYYVLFEDPDGIRLEVNFVPGAGLLADGAHFNPATGYI